MRGTDPNNPDTDGDGLGDWVEGIRNTNPLKQNFSMDKPGGELDDVASELRALRGKGAERGDHRSARAQHLPRRGEVADR